MARKPKKLRPAELTEDQILAWCDAYHTAVGPLSPDRSEFHCHRP
jgi:hypothetical protein